MDNKFTLEDILEEFAGKPKRSDILRAVNKAIAEHEILYGKNTKRQGAIRHITITPKPPNQTE
jgi:hypothetical protein